MIPVGLFLLLGILGLVAMAIRNAIRHAMERRRLVQQHPNEPWMWRQDWIDRAVRATNSVNTGFLWFFAIVWNLITLPVFFIHRAQPPGQPFGTWFLALFPLAGAGVLASAIYQTLRQRKYGVSLCRIHHLPIPIGGALQGEIEARVRQIPEGGFQVRLTNVRRIITGSGKHRSVRENILWQDEQMIGSGAAMPSPDGVRIPFRFAIPADGEATDHSNSRDSILWRFQIDADVPGIDYRGIFELPVFRTGEVSDDRFASAPAPWTPPPRIAIADDGIAIAPKRSFGDWFGYLAFLALWFSALEFMRRAGAPLWVVLLFAFFGLFVLLAALDFLLGHTSLSITREGLLARRSWLGLGASRSIAMDDIDSIRAKTGTTYGTRAFYDVAVVLRGGASIKIARHLETRRDAEGLARRITDALARYGKFA